MFKLYKKNKIKQKTPFAFHKNRQKSTWPEEQPVASPTPAVVSLGWAHLHRTVLRTPLGPPELSPVPRPPTPSNSQTHVESDFQFFFSFTHQLVHKIFLFYIFYTNVTKRWEGAVADSVFMLINGGGEEDGAQANKNRTVSMETSWEAGLGARGGWLSGFILGERWRCVVDANCYVTHRGGRGRGRRSRKRVF